MVNSGTVADSSGRYPVPEWAVRQAAWLRLEDQLGWYAKKAADYQRTYHRFKLLQILLAVCIPLLGNFRWDSGAVLASAAGGLIALIEGVHQVKQYATRWVEYRGVAEWLKREKFLFLAQAGPYRGLDAADSLVLLAERTEDVLAREQGGWAQSVLAATRSGVGRAPEAGRNGEASER